MAAAITNPTSSSTIFLRAVAFVMKVQMKQLFQAKNSLSVLGRVLFTALLLLYAVGFGFAILYAERLHLTVESLLWGINTALALLTFVKSYFPAYQTTSQPIASYYPMSRLQKVFMGITLDVLSLFPLGMMVFYVVMFSIGFTALSVTQIGSSLLFFLGIVMLERSLRLVLEYNINMRGTWGIGICLLTVLLFAQSAFNLPFGIGLLANTRHIALPALFILAVLVQVVLARETVLSQTERAVSTTSKTLSSGASMLSAPLYAMKAFFGSKHVYMLFGVAILLKFGLMAFFVLQMRKPQEIEPIMMYVLSIYTAPIAWFTYLLNNTFGMNWQLWQSYHQNGKNRNTILLYLRYSSVAIILDAAITFGTLVPLGLVRTGLVVNWCAALLTFLAWGLVVAVLMPIKVEKLTSSVWMSLRSVSSTGGMIGVIVGLIVISFLSALHVFLPLIVPVLALGGAIYVFLNYSHLKYTTYNGIHR